MNTRTMPPIKIQPPTKATGATPGTISAYLRRYRVEYSPKYGTRIATPISDTLIDQYPDPHTAYKSTRSYVRRNWARGEVQDVWFQHYTPDRTTIQLELFN